jgi:thymidylate synthase
MADECTRQAVISIWRPCPRPSKDIPCTLSLQFLLRDNIHMDCVASMRSSDSYLGIPYDIFTFSMISWYIALMIYFESDHVVHPRHLHIVAGSQHLYERDLGKVEHCNSWTDGVNFDHDYIQMTHPDELLEHLEQRRDDAYNRQQLTRDQ